MTVAHHLSVHLSPSATSAARQQIITHSSQQASQYHLRDIGRLGRQFAARLNQAGVGAGDVVAVQLPAWGEWLICAYGALCAGATLLPITTIYGKQELAHVLRDSAATAYIGPAQWKGLCYRGLLTSCGALPSLRHRLFLGDAPQRDEWDWAEMTRPLSPPPSPWLLPDADAPAMLVYTSGTTSAPKAVQHSSRSIWAELQSQNMVRNVQGSERILSPWPPGHVAGALSMLRFLMGNSDLILMDEWAPQDAARLVEQHRITTMSTTPFHLSSLLDAADAIGADLSSLTSLLSGAAPVPPSLISRCEARGLHPFRCYGSSEMPTVSMGRPTDPLEKRLTTEGRLMPDVEIRFLDDEGQDVEEGEIALRGPDLFIGYKDPETQDAAFTADGWFLSGDVGRLDAQGYLIITDRKKDIIIRGGENISSREVEEALRLHGDVADVAVVAAPDARMGEIVCAFLVTRSSNILGLDDVRRHLAACGLAKQKCPEMLHFLSELPRNPTGKILKHQLRDTLYHSAAPLAASKGV